MGVSASIQGRVSATYTETPPVGSAQQIVNESPLVSLNAGTGVGNSDTMLTQALNIAASGSTTIDLTGAATDAFGATVNLADVQALLVEADKGNTNNIVLGAAGANPWVGPFGGTTPTIAVKPGGFLLLADPSGWPVIAATGDQLKVANSGAGTAVTGKITLIGRSA